MEARALGEGWGECIQQIHKREKEIWSVPEGKLGEEDIGKSLQKRKRYRTWNVPAFYGLILLALRSSRLSSGFLYWNSQQLSLCQYSCAHTLNIGSCSLFQHLLQCWNSGMVSATPPRNWLGAIHINRNERALSDHKRSSFWYPSYNAEIHKSNCSVDHFYIFTNSRGGLTATKQSQTQNRIVQIQFSLLITTNWLRSSY